MDPRTEANILGIAVNALPWATPCLESLAAVRPRWSGRHLQVRRIRQRASRLLGDGELSAGQELGPWRLLLS